MVHKKNKDLDEKNYVYVSEPEKWDSDLQLETKSTYSDISNR